MADPNKQQANSDEDFGYLPPPREDYYRPEEGLKDKFIRKTKENPFVPFGVALTTFALTAGLVQFKTGNRRGSQKMMRLRILGQGFTICAVLAGVIYNTNQKNKAKSDGPPK